MSLRTTLLLLMLAAGVYACTLPLYLFFRLSAAASALKQGTEAVVVLKEDLARRDNALGRAAAITARVVASRRHPGPEILNGIRRLVEAGSLRSDTEPYATVPAAPRAALARAEEAMSRVGDAVTQVVGLLERHRWTDAEARVRAIADLDEGVDQHVLDVARLAHEELLQRQRVFHAASSEGPRVAIFWLGLGALALPLAIYLVRRRISRPLRALQAGLDRVADGDLTAQVPVLASDEIGQLAQHFNEMTRVLRGRVEEQGRFAAAGELLAGVAHEVNNPLMAIAAHAENRVADPGTTDEQRGEMLQILRQARRASKLLRGLLRFVRVTEPEVANVNLNEVVRGALDLVSYRFGVDEITVGGRLDPTLPPVLCDAIRLEQVVVNLLANAIDALRAIKPPRELTVDSFVDGGRALVAVADNGRGVTAEMVARLFRPFATTKGRHGTGLGLYISRQIARDAGGELVLASTPGAGARFVLSLPVATPIAERVPEPEAARPEPQAAEPQRDGGRRAVESVAGLRVLIVDDEDAIRRPMVKFLTRRGAQVEEAGDGVEALARLAAQAPDVILVDLRMPRMGGVELYARLEETRPDLAARLLFLSGDVSQLAEPGNTPVARERVLVKPLELAELERRIVEFVRTGA